MPPYIAVGVHPRHDFLSGIAALIQAERFSFQVRFRWDDLFVEVRSGLWQACFDAEGFASVTANGFDAVGRARLREPFPGCAEGISGQQYLEVDLSGFFCTQDERSMAADLGCDGTHWLEVAHRDAEGGADSRAGLGSTDKQFPQGFFTVLHRCFDSVKKKRFESLEG